MSRAGGDIAIIGMACVFPGAPNLATYWRNIVGKVDSVGDPPKGLYPEPILGLGTGANGDEIYTRRGGYLGELARFDPLEYGVMPTSIDGGEPDHFLALRVAHEALADAGYLERRGDPAGVEVILGKGSPINPGHTNLLQHSVLIDQTLRVVKELHPEHDEEELGRLRQRLKASLPPLNAETVPSLVPNVVTGRIANRLDLMGVNYTIDAACASSLIAVELGMEDLRTGKCDLALVGGVQASTPPPILYAFCQLGALSRTGQIRPFDKAANGTLLGEGLGIVVLKRREDAERDGDRIYAVLKCVASASDGRAVGLLAPRLEGEVLALRRAYEATAVAPDTVELIEAHGTGTLVGDATEIKALTQVFGPCEGRGPTCAIGTVKSMISHLIPAAGIAGLIKTALALHHRILPPTLHCDDPNPSLELEKTPFYVNTESRPWIHGDPTPRRAGVNAFGFGGINAHAILEEHAGSDGPGLQTLLDEWPTELVVLQGRSRNQLVAEGDRLAEFLAREPTARLRDVAGTVNCPLSPGGQRLAIVASSVPDLQRKLAQALTRLRDPSCAGIKHRSGIYYRQEPEPVSVAFLFPGEGSQYPGMLSDLCLHFPEVRAAFDRADRVLAGGHQKTRLRHLVFPPPAPGGVQRSEASPLWRMDLAVATVFVADMAVLSLLRELGIEPDAMSGHSSGEFTALMAASAVALEDEDQLMERSLSLQAVYQDVAHEIPPASLLTVGGVERSLVEAVLADAAGSLHLAMDNCPHQIILCGTEEAVGPAMRRLQELGAICSRLPFNRAYHTALFEPVAERMASFYASMEMAAPRVPIYSCATAAPYPSDPRQARELAAGQWTRRVRFRETVEAMYGAGQRIFVEVGAGSILSGFVDDTLGRRPHLAVAFDPPGRRGLDALHHALAQLAAHGVTMRLDRLYRHRADRVDLDAHATTRAPSTEMTLTLDLPMQKLLRDGPATGDGPPPGRTEEPSEVYEQHQTGRSRAVPQRCITSGSVTRYLQTMERFLDTERRVMSAFLRPLPDTTGVPGQEQGGDRSFAIQVHSLHDGRLVGSCRVDPDVHVYLQDHTLGGRPSAKDPELLALRVVPLTVSVELMAAAGAILAPGRRLVGMRAVRAHRWIVIDDESRVLGVTAAATSSGEGIHVRLTDESERGTAAPDVLVEGTALFADGYSMPPAPAPPLPGPELSYPRNPRDPDDYYGVMFHGPALHSVESIERYATSGMEATLRVPTSDERLTLPPEGGLRTNPVLLDGALQVVGFWAWGQLDRGFTIFPIGCDALDLYDLPRAGSAVSCSARVNLVDGTISADIELVGSDGAVLGRIAGARFMRLFKWSRRFTQFALEPQRRMLSRPWAPPVAALRDGARCCRILRSETDEGSWPQILAALILNRRERAAYRVMAGSEAHRRDWLLGRLVAKDAVRLFLADRHGLEVAAADLEIAMDESGRPRLDEDVERALGVEVALSLSHTDGNAVAVAAAREGGRSIGVDLERLDDQHRDLAVSLFGSDERELLDAANGRQSEWVLRLWCAKEAAAKALGCRMGAVPTSLVADEVDFAAGTIRLHGSGTDITAHTGCEDGLVFATATT
jgi:acyl transferase domain-containing protein/phosphopantetheinyl transferase